MDEPAKRVAVENLVNRVSGVQLSIQELLRKLELQEHLEWPSMLESYTTIVGQLKSILEQLRTSPGGPNRDELCHLFRTISVLPIRLSPDVDPQLMELTDGRVQAWSHAVAPDYLRTKPGPQGEMKEVELSTADKRQSAETVSKQANGMNKQTDQFINSLDNIVRDEDRGGRDRFETFLSEDTKTLVMAMYQGKGLEHGVGGMNPSAGPMGGRAGMSRAAPSRPGHPYMRQ